ncbi:MAG TPA: beta-ketoacyl-ACP synthase II [Candidatus Baltobacteraceae bacterium]|nr:beta-ketoacyl-ACP synthase II [Candidatus Baltobacteraceae bacterium]
MTRVVVTGLGAVAPNGIGVDRFWDNLIQGVSGVAPIERFDASKHDVQIAGEVKGFDPLTWIEKKEVRKMDRFIQYAIAAAQMAFDDAGLKVTEENSHRMGVCVGTGMGGIPALEESHKILLDRGPGRVSAFFIPSIITNLGSGQISMRFGMKGPNSCVCTACATGNHALGDSFRIIQRGEADVMIAGGSEAVITPLTIAGFSAMRALSTRNAEPTRASRPFDKDRDGFVMGEGSGLMVLETLEHAQRRGARIYAEMIGYGMSADAYHMTLPALDGAVRSMRLSLADAKVAPSDVDYVNAHGTSTPAGDLNETNALKEVFGEHAKRLAVSSTKSMTGHLLGAAGGVESVITVLTIVRSVIPPTINQDTPDPECDLDYVPNVARKASVRVALSNSFGFGGTNATLAFKRFEE